MPTLPRPRGPLSESLLGALRRAPHRLARTQGPGDFEDLQLALYCCYELHYRGFDGVDAGWEWDPGLLGARAGLEARFEAELLELAGPPGPPPEPAEIDAELRALMAADDGPSLSRHIEREATLEQAREFVVHRSAYQLREADPHSWAIPRLWGAPKAALIEIQADEYGGGRPDRMHSALFARTMEALGLDPTYGASRARPPGDPLATETLMSLCGLPRRLRGAIAAPPALFEMTPSTPNRRYAGGFRRLGCE